MSRSECSVRFMVRCWSTTQLPGAFWVETWASLSKGTKNPRKCCRTSALKVNDQLFPRKWKKSIPSIEFSGDMLVFTGGSDSMDSSKSQHGYCLHQFLDSRTNLCAKVFIVKTTTSNRMQSDLLESLNISISVYLSWLLCGFYVQQLKHWKHAPKNIQPPYCVLWDLGPWLGTRELSHVRQTSWESWLPKNSSSDRTDE